MKKRPPTVPARRNDTVRQDITAVLGAGTLTAREISGQIGIPEKEVLSHLEHIAKSLSREGQSLVMKPSRCRKCGFLFRKRERLRKPGRCPVCRGESITEPLFTISAGKRTGSR